MKCAIGYPGCTSEVPWLHGDDHQECASSGEIRGLAGALETDQVSAVDKPSTRCPNRVPVHRGATSGRCHGVGARHSAVPSGGVTLDAEDLYDEAGPAPVIVDTSAVVAILRGEDDSGALARRILAHRAWMSAGSYVELMCARPIAGSGSHPPRRPPPADAGNRGDSGIG